MKIQYVSGAIGKLSEIKPVGDVLLLIGNNGKPDYIRRIASKWAKVFVVPAGDTINHDQIIWDMNKKNVHYMIQRKFFYEGVTFMGAPIEGKHTGLIEEDIGFFQTNICDTYNPIVCMSCAPPTHSIILRTQLINNYIYWFHGKGNICKKTNNIWEASNEYGRSGYINEWYTELK
jgi:hypothetical protein